MNAVAIRLSEGRFVSFTTELVLEEADVAAVFELRESCDGVTLQVVGLGTFASAHPQSGRIHASGLEVGERERFVLDPAGDGRVALRLASGDGAPPAGGAFALGTPFTLEQREPPVDVQPSGCCCGPGAHDHANWELETHARIVDAAVELLKGTPLPDARVFVNKFAADVAFWPAVHGGLRDADVLDRFTRPVIEIDSWKQPAWGSHFYDPDTRENYLHGQLGFPGIINAVSEGQRWFDVSVHFARRLLQLGTGIAAGDLLRRAGYALGLSLHFATDVTQPMHAANFANCFGEDRSGHFNKDDRRHANFELWVERQVQEGYLSGLPPLAPAEVELWRGKKAGDYLHEVAVESKGVWTSELRDIARTQGLDKDWSRARPALDRSLKLAPRRVARFLRNWFLTVQQAPPFDTRRWYRLEEPTRGENVCRITRTGEGTWWRRWTLDDDSSKLYFLPNADGTTAVACKAATDDIWTLYDHSGVLWLGVGRDRRGASSRFRVMEESHTAVRFYETVKDEAMMVDTGRWDGYICRWDPAWPNQRFRPHDAGPIERGDFDAIEGRWPGWRWITWAGADRRTGARGTGWATRYFAAPGETLDSIAERFGLDKAAVREANPGVGPGEVAGELVNVPYPSVEARQGETLADVARRVERPAERMLRVNPRVGYAEERLYAGQRIALPELLHVARAGDTFASIGAPFLLIATEIRTANPGKADPPPAGTPIYIPTPYQFEALVTTGPAETPPDAL